MVMRLGVKICGLRTLEDVSAVASTKASYAGFVFAPSPRQLDFHEALPLLMALPCDVASVGLFVNPSLSFLETALETLPLSFLQLHGQESPEYVAEIQDKFGLPIIKAIGISSKADLETVRLYETVADMLLLDHKAPSSQPAGGHGQSFDWSLLEGFSLSKPWFLAGGLRPENVKESIEKTRASLVDVSSGVEKIRGQKDAELIERFTEQAEIALKRRFCRGSPENHSVNVSC